MLLQTEAILLTEDLISQLKEIHGEKYTYTDVTPYGKYNKLITYICKECGDTNQQLLHNHLNGNGCRRCSYTQRAIRKRYSFEDIVAIGKELHGNEYEYLAIVNPTGKATNRKIKYRCTTCDTINEQSIYRFIHGTACKKCSRVRGASLARSKRQLTTLSLVRQVGHSIYRRKYRYIKLEKGECESRHKVTFFCNECNTEFTQNVETHLLRNGCPECVKRIRQKIRSSSNHSIIGMLRNKHKEYEFISVISVNNKVQVAFKCSSCSMIRTQDVVAMIQGRKCICTSKSIHELFASVRSKKSRAQDSCI